MAKKAVPAIKSVLPKVKLTIDSEDYFLVYDFNALTTAEEVTGLNLLQCLNFQNLNATKIRGLLYAALLRFQPDMKLEDAGNLLGSPNASDIMNKVVEAYLGSQPEPEKELPNV